MHGDRYYLGYCSGIYPARIRRYLGYLLLVCLWCWLGLLFDGIFLAVLLACLWCKFVKLLFDIYLKIQFISSINMPAFRWSSSTVNCFHQKWLQVSVSNIQQCSVSISESSVTTKTEIWQGPCCFRVHCTLEKIYPGTLVVQPCLQSLWLCMIKKGKWWKGKQVLSYIMCFKTESRNIHLSLNWIWGSKYALLWDSL